MIKYICIFLLSVFIASISQILLKKSAEKQYENKLKEYLNPSVIIAYGMFFGSSLVTVIAYKGVPLSMGPILEASGYFWVAMLSWILLGEKLKKKKAVGLLIIIIGIIIYAI